MVELNRVLSEFYLYLISYHIGIFDDMTIFLRIKEMAFIAGTITNFL